MALNERDFVTEKTELRTVNCRRTRCRHRDGSKVKWIRRTKKERSPPEAASLVRRA